MKDLDLKKLGINIRRKREAKGGFDYVIAAVDQDLDGTHISTLLAGFIERYLPEFRNKFCKINTPVKAVIKNGKPIRWVYNLKDHIEAKPGETLKYFKGLGTWKADMLQEVIRVDGLEKMIVKFDFKDLEDHEIIKDFLSSDESDKRKDYIKNNNFSIAKL